MKSSCLFWMLMATTSLYRMAAQSPQELPLFDISKLTYEGGFRIKASENGVSDVNFSQGPIAYNYENHSLFIVGHSHHQAIAEYAIPEIVKSEELSELNMVETPLQVFCTVLDKAEGGNPDHLDSVGGLYYVNHGGRPKLIVNAYEYYDAPADNTLSTLIVENADDLENSSISGYFRFEGVAAHTSGWISPIPETWQEIFGGSHITGHSSGIPIISRCSVGPSAFSFDMTEALNATDAIATTTLLDFSLSNPLHEDLSNESGTNDIWTHLSRATYGFIVPGTRTYLTLGSSGGYESGVCYKCVQDNGNLCGGYCTPEADDNYQYYWLWDVNDLVAVKNGSLQPYEVRPYDHGFFNTPFQSNGAKNIGGGSFDPATGNLYLSVQHGDMEQGPYSRPPVIVVYHIHGEVLDENRPVGSVELTMYPNPTSDILYIEGLTGKSHIQIHDMAGKLVQALTTDTTAYELDMGGLSSGVYVVSVHNLGNRKRTTEQIIKVD